MTDKPTIETMLAVWREEYEEGEWVHVHDKVDGSWRHGSCHEFVAKRVSDGTFWMVSYRTNPSGDYNDFRDGDLYDSDVVRVWPSVVTKTVYTTKDPSKT
ncbi:MAG: hypothetical protein AB1698_01615 [Pseudomonadota bacterium]